jgi:predicted metal-dependent hydrolase
VAIHELSHIATKSIGHKTEFWENFKFLLEQAKAAGIHAPKDYKKEPQKYCGMTIRDSPAFDL